MVIIIDGNQCVYKGLITDLDAREFAVDKRSFVYRHPDATRYIDVA
jgi:hypothetical protein